MRAKRRPRHRQPRLYTACWLVRALTSGVLKRSGHIWLDSGRPSLRPRLCGPSALLCKQGEVRILTQVSLPVLWNGIWIGSSHCYHYKQDFS